MARRVGQIIARGDRRWLIRVYLGRDHETKKRNHHNRTIHGSRREAQAYLTRKLRERDLGRDLEGAKITLNEYLDRWLKTAVLALSILEALSARQRDRLMTAMGEVERLLQASMCASQSKTRPPPMPDGASTNILLSSTGALKEVLILGSASPPAHKN
jgi:hypothetical protein